MSYSTLLLTTNAYRIIAADKRGGTLSHGYLVFCHDGKMLRFYLKELAKLIMCDAENGYCDNCRVCRLIEKEAYFDCDIYPKNGEKIKVEDIDEVVFEKSVLKPLENDKRLFVFSNADDMNEPSQNKLLKTLEEPPENVHMLLGAVSEFSLLPTVKSRVKKVEIPWFTPEILVNNLKDIFPDLNKLTIAAELCGGDASRIADYYNGDGLFSLIDESIKLVTKLKTSADALGCSKMLIEKQREDLVDVFGCLRLVFRDILVVKHGGKTIIPNRNDEFETLADRFYSGALTEILETLNALMAQLKYNANNTMLVDKLLLKILEENYKWRKLSV